MRRSRFGLGSLRRRAALALLTTALLGAAACVDLFHSTDFPTLCALDAAACETEGGTADAQDVPDATPEAEAPPIDFCGHSPAAARQLAERSCARLGACLGTLAESSFGACMLRALAAYDCSFNPSLRPRGESAVLWDCLAKAETCDAVSICVFGTPPPPCNVAAGTFTACNRQTDGASETAGPVVIECGDSTVPLGMAACALGGRSCAKVDDGKSICAGKRGAACTVTPRCEETFAVHCRSAGGIDSDEGTDCAAVGAGRCAGDDAGVACAPPADAGACAVAKTTAVACSDGGTFAESCVGGLAVKMNCAAIGQGCNADGVRPVDPIAACKNLDAGSACTATEDECAGSALRSCAQGQLFEVDCTAIDGLGTCDKPAGRRATCTER
ncbi:MAG TPA: hypothetical protein VM204_06450 [Gaiellaceae bacterium]|nr:hypothetical protein [Gaiellaceae bacterium]